MASIRMLQKSDGLRELIDLSRAFFEEYEAHHGSFFQIGALSDEEIAEYFSRFSERDDHAVFVAVRDDLIVGYITVYIERRPTYWRVRRVGHISGFMVREEDRRAGIGTQLLEHARVYLAERRVRFYTAYTAVRNTGAIEFYEKRGMEPLYSHMMGETKDVRE